MKTNKRNSSSSVVIIPAYEPPSSFTDYLISLSERGFEKLVVVNDGSGEKYAEIFKKIKEIPSVELISYDVNMGKGHALKTAFRYCLDNFAEDDVFVTADCDGQHLAADVESVAKEAARHREALVLGSRDFSLDCVPKRSRAGNLFTRKIFSLLYGISLSDTQTGLRAFSYSLLDELISISGERFEYEMNMLIALKKHRISIIEKEIATVYKEEPEGCERVSHFRSVRDSARVIGVLFKNLGWYFLSSLISAVVEIAVFFLLTSLAVGVDLRPLAVKMLIPTVGARIISSVFNFFFNFRLVFRGKSKRSLLRYYALWTVQLGASYGIACGFGAIFGSLAPTSAGLLITLCKSFCDLIIALFSYQIQSRWVFADKPRDKNRFYGAYLRFWRVIYNIFVKKYKSRVEPPEGEPHVYISRHLNTQAPVVICQSLGFDLHFFVLHNFFGFRKVYKQYREYTFTAKHDLRGIKLFFAKIAAFFAALWFAPMVKSIKAIPVYRGGSDSMITFKRAMEYLGRGESLIVFPDIDYSADEKTPSEIYTGFLFLDKLYYKKHGRHLCFVTLKVDSECREITETGRVTLGDGDFNVEMEAAAYRLHSLLMD